MRYRAALAYDGTDYEGFQRQADGHRTVQSAVEQAIHTVTGQVVTVSGAGRTDSGVHAVGQVIAFDMTWQHGDEALLNALNANLPDDIALQDLRPQPDFHPRFDALSRAYRYHVVQAMQPQPLLQRYAWRVYHPLNVDAMNEAAALLLGEHNFAAFGQPPVGENTIRTVFVSRWSASRKPYGWMLDYEIEANAFLYRMVRRIVGVLVDVGRAALTTADFVDILESADIARSKRMAPPQGLILEKVRYPGDI